MRRNRRPHSVCLRLSLFLTSLVAVVAVLGQPEASKAHSLRATSAEVRGGLAGQARHLRRALRHYRTALVWCQHHKRLFKGTAGHDCYWPHYRLARKAERKLAKVEARLIPSGWPGIPPMPRYLANATLQVFGRAKFAQAQCIAWYENSYTWVVSSTGDWSPWQINYASWSGTFDFSRLNGPEDAVYAARAAYRISSGGTNWNPWVVYWKWGVCH